MFQTKIGLNQLINYLLIVLAFQAVVYCFAFDYGGRNSKRSHLTTGLIEAQHSFSSAYKTSAFQTLRNTSQQRFYRRRNRNRTGQSNYKESDYLWRNPKAVTIKNIEFTTRRPKRRSHMVSRHKIKSTTPSYIEFEYLNENQDYVNNNSVRRLHRVDDHGIVRKYKTRMPFILRPSSVLHGCNDTYNMQDVLVLPITRSSKSLPDYTINPHINDNLKKNKVDITSKKNYIKDIDYTDNLALSGRNLATVKVYLNGPQAAKTKITPLSALSTTLTLTPSFTTPDDRVKFFEMYDTNTPRSPAKVKQLNNNRKYKNQLAKTQSNKLDQESNYTNSIWRVDNSNKTSIESKFKHFMKRSFITDGNLANLYKVRDSQLSEVHRSSNENSSFAFSKSNALTKTTVAQWSSYPFASVYVYKPTQTHCDAAGISPHWLLAAGSCLSRRDFVNSIDERSAFVTYCGEHWRSPERIAYVKRSVVHPKFDSEDKIKRLLYNIGLIQVSSSMSTSCPLWAPVSLMPHQVSAGPGGTLATAVGWGLDRYGTKYSYEKLPHWPLTVYDALVYHDTCPGSSTFSVAKRQNYIGANNVYCLLLPPYTGNEDPVHGGLLLVGGNLVALYLQEERHSWGSQSAQYTGVWPLLPWISDVAHEPDDAEITFYV